MSETHPDWQNTVNAILIDHEGRIAAMERNDIDMDDAEYAIPGELQAYKPTRRLVEAWPEKAQRRIETLERQVFEMRTEIEHLRDDMKRLAEQAGMI